MSEGRNPKLELKYGNSLTFNRTNNSSIVGSGAGWAVVIGMAEGALTGINCVSPLGAWYIIYSRPLIIRRIPCEPVVRPVVLIKPGYSRDNCRVFEPNTCFHLFPAFRSIPPVDFRFNLLIII
ncbi:hypothetical protein GQX74_003370 [Glossina fuscipes]|nr:hypothetical protein GQX74_003370 [Glossina fuscipes]